MFELPGDAPAWVVYAYWTAFAIFAALFMVVTPRLRSLATRLTAPPINPATRAVGVMGAAVGMSQDAPKIAHELERIADAAEVIAEAAKSLAKSEEQGTHRVLEELADRLRHIDRRFEGR